MIKQFMVYEHIREDSGEVFYVGKGTGYRPHQKTSRNKYWKSVAKKGYTVNIVKYFEDEDEAYNFEADLILQYKRKNIQLTNLDNGGRNGRSGRKQSQQEKLKRSQSLRGKAKTQEHCEMIRKAKLGIKNPMFGKPSRRKQVIDTATQQLYLSLSHAANTFQIHVSNLCNMLNGKINNYTTLRYV